MTETRPSQEEKDRRLVQLEIEQGSGSLTRESVCVCECEAETERERKREEEEAASSFEIRQEDNRNEPQDGKWTTRSELVVCYSSCLWEEAHGKTTTVTHEGPWTVMRPQAWLRFE